MKILIIGLLLLFVGCAKKESGNQPENRRDADSSYTDKILATQQAFEKRVYRIGYNCGVYLYMVDGHEIININGDRTSFHSPACIERDFEKQVKH